MDLMYLMYLSNLMYLTYLLNLMYLTYLLNLRYLQYYIKDLQIIEERVRGCNEKKVS